ncbi:putative alcohol acetyltransferase crmB [Exophiala dermatitidis]
MEDFEKLRPVGRLERWSTARHDLKFYMNAAVTAAYTLPETCTLPLKHYMHKACKSVVGRHPILSAIPVGENTNEPQFVRLPEIDLDQCVSFHDRRHDAPGPSTPSSADTGSSDSKSDANGDPNLDELLTIQHNTAFQAPNPFWRLCILTTSTQPHQFTAAFVFHHAIGDGTSGLAFHRTFHEALSQAASADPNLDKQETNSVIPSPSIPLLPNIEALHPMPVSLLYVLSILFREKIWSARRDPGLWTGSKIHTPLKTRVRHLAFSASNTRGFIDACRAHDTTVTAALQTLIAGVLFSHLPSNFTTLKCNGAISVRRWLPDMIDDDSMGVYVQNLAEDYSRNKFHTETLPWDEARRSRRTIEQVLSLKGKNAAPNMLRYVNNYQQELFLSKVGKDRDSSYEVSNLGVYKGKLENDKGSPATTVQIGRMLFTQSANVTGSAFEVSAVSGADGCLVLGFSWQESVVDDALMDTVMKTVEEALLALTRDQPRGD